MVTAQFPVPASKTNPQIIRFKKTQIPKQQQQKKKHKRGENFQMFKANQFFLYTPDQCDVTFDTSSVYLKSPFRT